MKPNPLQRLFKRYGCYVVKIHGKPPTAAKLMHQGKQFTIQTTGGKQKVVARLTAHGAVPLPERPKSFWMRHNAQKMRSGSVQSAGRGTSPA